MILVYLDTFQVYWSIQKQEHKYYACAERLSFLKLFERFEKVNSDAARKSSKEGMVRNHNVMESYNKC